MSLGTWLGWQSAIFMWSSSRTGGVGEHRSIQASKCDTPASVALYVTRAGARCPKRPRETPVRPGAVAPSGGDDGGVPPTARTSRSRVSDSRAAYTPDGAKAKEPKRACSRWASS
jgi:hypothetical protein